MYIVFHGCEGESGWLEIFSLAYIYCFSLSHVPTQIDAKEAAQVFEQFVASFEDPGKTGKTFVRGSTINPESSSSSSECACVCVCVCE